MMPAFRLRVFVRLFIYFLFTLICIPFQVLFVLFRLPWRQSFPHFYHKITLLIMGIDVTVEGEKPVKGPVLYVCNHSSFLDISILGAVLRASFISKAEVKSLPYYGVLAVLQQTLFIERNPAKVLKQKEKIINRLRQGDALIIFPEGTRGPGYRLLPFRSALLSASELKLDGSSVPVQPLSLAYRSLDGFPLGREQRYFFVWSGKTNVFKAMLRSFGLGKLGVKVRLYAPVTLESFKDRKALTRHCEEQISSGLSDSLHPNKRLKNL